MPTCPATPPTCAACGAVLTPTEQEANLLVTSQLIATGWPLPIRVLCARCVEDDSSDSKPLLPRAAGAGVAQIPPRPAVGATGRGPPRP